MADDRNVRSGQDLYQIDLSQPHEVAYWTKALGITKAALCNQISAGTCPVKTYLDGAKRWADYRDVAEHFDRCRALAA